MMMRGVMIFPFVEFEAHAPSCTRRDPRHQSVAPIITPTIPIIMIMTRKTIITPTIPIIMIMRMEKVVDHDDDDGESDDSNCSHQWSIYHMLGPSMVLARFLVITTWISLENSLAGFSEEVNHNHQDNGQRGSIWKCEQAIFPSCLVPGQSCSSPRHIADKFSAPSTPRLQLKWHDLNLTEVWHRFQKRKSLQSTLLALTVKSLCFLNI